MRYAVMHWRDKKWWLCARGLMNGIHEYTSGCTGEIKNTTHFSVLVDVDVGIQRLDVLVLVGIGVRFRCQRLELLRAKI